MLETKLDLRQTLFSILTCFNQDNDRSDLLKKKVQEKRRHTNCLLENPIKVGRLDFTQIHTYFLILLYLR